MLMRRYYPMITRNALEPIDVMANLDQTRKQLYRIFNNDLNWDNDQDKTPATFPVELTETPEVYKLKALVPGVQAEQIDIQATADTITLCVTWQPEAHETTENVNGNGTVKEVNEKPEQTPSPLVHIREFQYGKMERSIQFAQPILNDQITAEFKNGILTLTIPKENASKKRPVKITIPT